MKHTITPILAAAIAFQFLPSASLAATKADRLSSCIEGALSQNESEKLLAEITEWTHLFTDYSKRNAGVCYETLTGEFALFVQGEGLVVGSEAQHVLAERKRLAEEAEAEAKRLAEEAQAKAEAVLLQLKSREDLKCSLLEEWEALSSEKAKADEIINADALSNDERKSEAYLETYIACRDWYSSDRTKALTSTVCSPMFLEFGLPDSEIAGPTRDEVLLAELEATRASLKLYSLSSELLRIESDEEYVSKNSEEALYDLKQRVAAEMDAKAALQALSDGEPLSSCEVLWLKWKNEN